MPTCSFHEWLGNRAEEIPDIGNLTLLITQSGAAGISQDDLRRLTRFSPSTLGEVLKALVATGQVVVLKVDGQFVYRATT